MCRNTVGRRRDHPGELRARRQRGREEQVPDDEQHHRHGEQVEVGRPPAACGRSPRRRSAAVAPRPRGGTSMRGPGRAPVGGAARRRPRRRRTRRRSSGARHRGRADQVAVVQRRRHDPAQDQHAERAVAAPSPRRERFQRRKPPEANWRISARRSCSPATAPPRPSTGPARAPRPGSRRGARRPPSTPTTRSRRSTASMSRLTRSGSCAVLPSNWWRKRGSRTSSPRGSR